MEVRPGYKQTEVGVIPEEWAVKLLPEVLRFRGGKAHEQHISETGRYICVNSKFISTEGNVRKYSIANFCPAKKGDVLMVMSDLPNGRALAKAYLVENDDIYAVNQRVCALTTYRDCPEYFFHVLNRHPYFLKFDDGVSQTHLLNHVFQKCPIPVPPNVAEQRAIAAALSDVDALLGGLDRLIAKKRDLKQAAMQQLLTGQTRLPGFSGAWEVKRLGQLAILKNGYAFKSDTYTSLGTFKVITIANVQSGYMTADSCNTIKSVPVDLQPHQLLSRGDIIMSMTGNVGRVCCVSEDRCLLNQRVGKLVPVGVAETLLFFLLDQPSFVSAMTAVAKGGAQPNLSASDITDYAFHIPKDAAEQTAIAAVLSDMDAELAALEARRDKTRGLKQAMMQELLTGRIRII
jgi:type I restriction enzyme S subunit